MPALTPCIWCGNVGMVRSEHVIRGSKADVVFTCGQCERSWRVPDGTRASKPRAVRRTGADKPDRSRP
jgi:hypothetical protein